MAKKKTTKKEVAVNEIDTIETVTPTMEPEVSMEDFTMIEKYQQGKNQTIAIRPYVTDSENMGLENYSMSLYDNVYHEEQLTCLDVNGVRRYITGLNEFAPEIKQLEPSKRKAKIKQIRTAVAELEKELAQNVISVDDPEFWNKVKLLRPNNDEFWSKISVRAGNDPLYLDPKKDAYDLIKIFAIEAGGFSIVAKSLEEAKRKGPSCKFYLDNVKDTVNTRTKTSKVRNRALAALQNLYDSNPTKLKYVGMVVDQYQAYVNSTPNDVIYEDMDNYINGFGRESNKGLAAKQFLDTANLSLDELKLTAVIKCARYYKFLMDKSDGFIYTDNNVRLGRTLDDALTFLSSPLNDEVLMYVLNKVEHEWSL
tara:strand:+ start:253 stop:1353 length:1101 start_codon:yes stop_codon:yes gene_type:complete